MISVHSSVILDQFILPSTVQPSQEGWIWNHLNPWENPLHLYISAKWHTSRAIPRSFVEPPRGFLGFFSGPNTEALTLYKNDLIQSRHRSWVEKIQESICKIYVSKYLYLYIFISKDSMNLAIGVYIYIIIYDTQMHVMFMEGSLGGKPPRYERWCSLLGYVYLR